MSQGWKARRRRKNPYLPQNLIALYNNRLNFSVFSSQSLDIEIEIAFTLKTHFAFNIVSNTLLP